MPKIYRVGTINNTTYYSRLKDVPSEKGELYDVISVDAVEECEYLWKLINDLQSEINMLQMALGDVLDYSPRETRKLQDVKNAIDVYRKYNRSAAEYFDVKED